MRSRSRVVEWLVAVVIAAGLVVAAADGAAATFCVFHNAESAAAHDVVGIGTVVDLTVERIDEPVRDAGGATSLVFTTGPRNVYTATIEAERALRGEIPARFTATWTVSVAPSPVAGCPGPSVDVGERTVVLGREGQPMRLVIPRGGVSFAAEVERSFEAVSQPTEPAAAVVAGSTDQPGARFEMRDAFGQVVAFGGGTLYPYEFATCSDNATLLTLASTRPRSGPALLEYRDASSLEVVDVVELPIVEQLLTGTRKNVRDLHCVVDGDGQVTAVYMVGRGNRRVEVQPEVHVVSADGVKVSQQPAEAIAVDADRRVIWLRSEGENGTLRAIDFAGNELHESVTDSEIRWLSVDPETGDAVAIGKQPSNQMEAQIYRVGIGGELMIMPIPDGHGPTYVATMGGGYLTVVQGGKRAQLRDALGEIVTTLNQVRMQAQRGEPTLVVAGGKDFERVGRVMVDEDDGSLVLRSFSVYPQTVRALPTGSFAPVVAPDLPPAYEPTGRIVDVDLSAVPELDDAAAPGARIPGRTDSSTQTQVQSSDTLEHSLREGADGGTGDGGLAVAVAIALAVVVAAFVWRTRRPANDDLGAGQ